MSAQEIRLRANAKLNLTLDITGTRADGYHLMEMVNVSVDLSDVLVIRRADPGAGVRISSNARFLPRSEKNLVYKAAAALSEKLSVPLPDAEFDIQKHIPTQAGLGGGSADAAAALIGLNELFGYGLSAAELCAAGESVGADVPYCVVGGPARVTGIGEIVEPVPSALDCCFVVLMPREGHSTKEAFARFDAGEHFGRPDTAGMLAALAAGDPASMAMRLGNVFRTAVRDETTERLIALLCANGALGASMTGTGAAVFGVFPDYFAARGCKLRLFAQDVRVYTARPQKCGVKIIDMR
ncbi:MAG: 4-(cytidine 5'-diphospho)-2-C-methyl-D-erythritol kinase [Oscillospiraceae bacterium]|nr:4-(cytidine 5'-diphospho)-2-C-methyl-D-erythritol kinase [Oscillospiraceae bacterium]